MSEEINEYIQYLSTFSMVEKPQMPKFDTFAYTDNEYLCAVNFIMEDFDKVDDEYLIIQHLKGE